MACILLGFSGLYFIKTISQLLKWVRKMPKRNKNLSLAIMLSLASAASVNATVWTQNITGGTIKFDDWGYIGPGGRTAVEFAPINGFGGPTEGNTLDPAGGVGQIQHVVTLNPDGLTPDSPYSFLAEFTNAPLYPDANTDGKVNFFYWGYTTVAGSTFNNMQIDYDGDYLVPRNDMVFSFYDSFEYINEGSDPIAPANGVYPTTIGFQPYALSNAAGWCGSVMVSNPVSTEAMAGQVQFDFGFETFFSWSPKDANGNYIAGEGSMQIVSNFQMRSYGTVTVEVSTANGGNGDITYSANAVVNNTNPTISNVNPVTGLKEVGGGNSPDEAWYNKVSFMGAGIVPEGVWVLVDENAGITTKPTGDLAIRNDQILRVVDGVEAVVPTEAIPAGTVWMYHYNFFRNYTFILRADGIRVPNAFDFAVYNDLSNVPAAAFNASGELINLDGNVIRDLSRTDVNPIDPDGDGLVDWHDNCRNVANADQQDTDGDKYGNACDADFNDDGFVNSLDIGLLKQMFLTSGDVEADMNGDQLVNSLDLGLFKAQFLQPVGESGTVK